MPETKTQAGRVTLTIQSGDEFVETELSRPTWDALMSSLEVGSDGVEDWTDFGVGEAVLELVARLRSV